MCELKFGDVCHLEIPAPDLEKARAFSGEVFGWQFTPMGEESLLFHAGHTGGGLDPSMPVGDGGAIPVLAVEDIDAKLAQISAAGGEALTPKTEIPDGHGFCAYFRDPNGNRMGIWMSAQG